MTTPAMRFIVIIWCGRKRRRKTLIRSVSKSHQAVAPPKKPAIVRRLFMTVVAFFVSSGDEMPNIAKKASRYGMTVTKFAIVKPNIETKWRQ